jgi:hypothetical protein
MKAGQSKGTAALSLNALRPWAALPRFLTIASARVPVRPKPFRSVPKARSDRCANSHQASEENGRIVVT